MSNADWWEVSYLSLGILLGIIVSRLVWPRTLYRCIQCKACSEHVKPGTPTTKNGPYREPAIPDSKEAIQPHDTPEAALDIQLKIVSKKFASGEMNHTDFRNQLINHRQALESLDLLRHVQRERKS